MSKVAPPPRWFAVWRSGARPPQDDPADLGTAFGLDMSLNELYTEPVQAPPPVPRGPGWMRRFTARRRPTA